MEFPFSPPEDDFRRMSKSVEEVKCPFHTFRLQAEKLLKTVIRSIPVEISRDGIVADLREQGFSMDSVHRMSARHNKQPVSLVFVTLRTELSIKDIFSVKIITVESKHKVSGKLSQRHAQSGCRVDAKCIRCGETHYIFPVSRFRRFSPLRQL